jgi:hypothetical protein
MISGEQRQEAGRPSEAILVLLGAGPSRGAGLFTVNRFLVIVVCLGKIGRGVKVPVVFCNRGSEDNVLLEVGVVLSSRAAALEEGSQEGR